MTSIYNNPLASLYGSSLYNSKLGALDYDLTDRYGTYGNSDSLYDTTSFDTDLTSLYGGYGKNTSKAELLRQNRILKAQLLKLKEEADEPSKDLLGLDRLFANGKDGGVGITDMLIGAVLPGLLKGFGGGKDGKDGGGLGGILDGLFGG